MRPPLSTTSASPPHHPAADSHARTQTLQQALLQEAAPTEGSIGEPLAVTPADSAAVPAPPATVRRRRSSPVVVTTPYVENAAEVEPRE